MKFPDDVPTLTAGDVTLRAHRLEDAEAIVEQCTDPLSIEWTTVPPGLTCDDAIEFATKTVPEGWVSGKEYAFAIESTHPGGNRRFSGTLSLRDEGANRAELAFGAHPAIRGRGIMTTAVNLLLDWGFSARGLETVIWLANKGNFASRRVAWKTGFTFGGTVRRWLDHRGEHLDAWVASLHKDDSRDPKTIWYDVPRIVGERLVLRPLLDTDVPRIVEGCRDERTQHWLAFMPSPYDEPAARDYLERVREGLTTGSWTQVWAIADPASEVLLGNVGIPRMARDSGEIGYWMHPDARGKGLMREAVRLVVRHAFLDPGDGGLGMRRLWLGAAADNTASGHVARANGFTEYGRERKSERLGDGSYADVILFDLLASEWSVDRHGV
ncbi:MAG: GNAT family N-acetyltransferase [Nocardioidaceae bacterium]